MSICEGDLHDRDALVVFTRYRRSGSLCGAPRNLSSWRELRAHHVDGTDCLASSTSSGVRRLVHLSSLPTTGDIAEGRVEGLGIARYEPDAFQQTSLEGSVLRSATIAPMTSKFSCFGRPILRASRG